MNLGKFTYYLVYIYKKCNFKLLILLILTTQVLKKPL